MLIEAPTTEIQRAVGVMQDAMADASKIVLAGFVIRTDVEFIHYPNRYVDERGVEMLSWMRGYCEENGRSDLLQDVTGTCNIL